LITVLGGNLCLPLFSFGFVVDINSVCSIGIMKKILNHDLICFWNSLHLQ